ncbi:MAG: PAS domain-containing protein [Proteobacteria bacterium]|nr:PAS domain-containing protein [Pseudomonadota bacterium]
MTEDRQMERRLSSVLKFGSEDGLSDARQHTSLKFITGVRCLYGVLVLIYSLLWYYLGQTGGFEPTLELLLISTTEIFIFTAICCVALIRKQLIRTVTYIGMAHDALLAAFIVIFTGYQSSPFSYLFLIIPLYGGITLQRKGGLIGATVVSAVLAGVYFTISIWIYRLPADMVNIFFASSGIAGAGMSRFAAVGVAAYCVGLLTGQLAYLYANAQAVIWDNARAFRHLRGIYEHILNTLPVGVIIHNPETHRILYANPMVEKILGDIETAEDWFSALSRPGNIPAFSEHDRSESVATVDSDTWICEREGGYYRITEFNLPLEIGKSESEVLLGYQIADMTSEMRAQLEKNRQQRLALLGEFSAKIAHEIRNPLTCISGCNEMLQSEVQDEEQLQIMEMMGCEIERLNRLLNDILVFARRPKLTLEPVCVRDILNGQWQVFASDACNREMVLECTVPDDMVVEYDGNSLRQIMMTLWRNSSEALSGKGAVRVRGTKTPAVLYVSDSGDGLSEAQAAQAFEPFFTTKKSGTGLGLSIARQLAIDNKSELTWCAELKEFSLKFGE